MEPFPRILILLVATVLASCTNVFEYSPYDANVHSRNLNTSHANTVSDTAADTLRFAFFSDSHEHYDDLADAISSINARDNVKFAICGGDVADDGLSYQFQWYTSAIENCDVPVFTLIGNHDCRSNGRQIHKRLFGPTSFTFVSGAYKFIFFDDVVWEKGNTVPDFTWLENELADSTYLNVVAAHIPPWDEQMEGLPRTLFTRIVTPSNTSLCLHGHEHGGVDKYCNDIHTLVCGSVNKRYYWEVTLAGNQSYCKQINF